MKGSESSMNSKAIFNKPAEFIAALASIIPKRSITPISILIKKDLRGIGNINMKAKKINGKWMKLINLGAPKAASTRGKKAITNVNNASVVISNFRIFIRC
ncbi:MAG TPA: hypothetical protein ENI73_09830 [Spirochaetes bacterium]|nr:hypothetical protein [Spirochaetota bacterium]